MVDLDDADAVLLVRAALATGDHRDIVTVASERSARTIFVLVPSPASELMRAMLGGDEYDAHRAAHCARAGGRTRHAE